VKRLTDLLVAVSALLVLSPLLLIIAVAVRMTLGKPVLFRQRRPGYRGELFELIKFRTMRQADPLNPDEPDGARMTRLGTFLRQTSLDELPQLWNVLVGEMSLVGPRPLLVEYLPLYTAQQARRHEVRPGLTGLAQVSGRNALTWEEKFELDVWYVDHVSLRLDISILMRTGFAVLRREGISQAGHVTAERFRGSRT